MTTKTKTKTKTTTKKAPTADNIKVVATDKKAMDGSFFHTVQKLAHKPIAQEALVAQVLKAVGKELRSKQDPAVVVRTRTRDGIKHELPAA